MGSLQVDAVCQFTKARDSMRCYLKGPSASPLVQFSQLSQDNDDPGDGGGVPVFASWALPYFGKLIYSLAILYQILWPIWFSIKKNGITLHIFRMIGLLGGSNAVFFDGPIMSTKKA